MALIVLVQSFPIVSNCCKYQIQMCVFYKDD